MAFERCSVGNDMDVEKHSSRVAANESLKFE